MKKVTLHFENGTRTTISDREYKHLKDTKSDWFFQNVAVVEEFCDMEDEQ